MKRRRELMNRMWNELREGKVKVRTKRSPYNRPWGPRGGVNV
jgi:hypothetical protein